MEVIPQKSMRSKNLYSSLISSNLQQIIDKQPLLLPQGTYFQFNNLIEEIENNTDNNMISLAVDKSIVDMELDN